MTTARLTTARCCCAPGGQAGDALRLREPGRHRARARAGGGVSTFDPRDVERLARSNRRGREPAPGGVPVGAHEHRRRPGQLPRRRRRRRCGGAHRFEEVAEWLWRGRWPEHTSWPFDPEALDQVLQAQAAVSTTCLPLDRYRIIAAVAAAADPVRHDTRPESVVPAARRLLRLLAHGLPRADRREARRVEPARTVGRGALDPP